MGEPGVLQTRGSQRIGHGLVTEHQQQQSHSEFSSWPARPFVIVPIVSDSASHYSPPCSLLTWPHRLLCCLHRCQHVPASQPLHLLVLLPGALIFQLSTCMEEPSLPLGPVQILSSQWLFLRLPYQKHNLPTAFPWPGAPHSFSALFSPHDSSFHTTYYRERFIYLLFVFFCSKVSSIRVRTFADILFFKKIFYSLFIYLAVPGLSCSMWDLVCWPGIKPGPLHWETGVLATGPPGKSLFMFFMT